MVSHVEPRGLLETEQGRSSWTWFCHLLHHFLHQQNFMYMV